MLTTTEQLLILKGDLKPPSRRELLDIIEQSSVVMANTTLTSYKQFDAAVETEAKIYLDKILALCNRIMLGDKSTYLSLSRIVISILAPTSDIVAVKAADDAAWEAFINANMFRAMELLADVRIENKTEYDNLPV